MSFGSSLTASKTVGGGSTREHPRCTGRQLNRMRHLHPTHGTLHDMRGVQGCGAHAAHTISTWRVFLGPVYWGQGCSTWGVRCTEWWTYGKCCAQGGMRGMWCMQDVVRARR